MPASPSTPISLETQFEKKFDEELRKKGRGLFEDQKLRKVDWRSDIALVTVRDRGERDVCLFHDAAVKSLKVSCSCEAFETQGNCEHVWAALLFADKKNSLREPNGRLPSAMKDFSEKDQSFVEAVLNRNIWSEEEFDEDDEVGGSSQAIKEPAGKASTALARMAPPPREVVSDWRQRLSGVAGMAAASWEREVADFWLNDCQLIYIIAANRQANGETFVLEWAYRQVAASGLTEIKKTQITRHDIAKLKDEADRNVMFELAGLSAVTSLYAHEYSVVANEVIVPVRLRERVLKLASATGRLLMRLPDRPNDSQLIPTTWDADGPWNMVVYAPLDPSGRFHIVQAVFNRQKSDVPIGTAIKVFNSGILFAQNKVSYVDDWPKHQWLAPFAGSKPLHVPVTEFEQFLSELFRTGNVPKLDLPPQYQIQEIVAEPKLHLVVSSERGRQGKLTADVCFEYGEAVVGTKSKADRVFDAAQRRIVQRDRQAEQALRRRVFEQGFTEAPQWSKADVEIAPRKFAELMPSFMAAGWKIESEGKLYRSAVGMDVSVKSGIDWFELHGTVDFGSTKAQLPELLAALKKGENSVVLPDGSLGMLPQEWLEKYGMLAGLGTKQADHLRFSASQVGLLDALLAAQPEATFDAVFDQARQRLKSFSGVAACDPVDSFTGTLRGYQREGLGWLHFLQEFQFNGCLADDMGLGKTVQVLALLDSRRKLRAELSPEKRPGPSLVVVPKTLIFNWKQETAKFAPLLRLLDHTGIERIKANEHFDEFDLIVTTYGTLRKDALLFKDVEFDYCILDEAQAIKNANTESAKAARLIRAKHRLAMSGTPVENHLGELWSLFEFLNPGMLGTASVLKLGGAGARNPSPESREILAKALRPFLLRRTKSEVAKDLPAKLEQTLYCELEADQRKHYDELRTHYRQSLLGRIDRDGLSKSKMHILEALLRLRQASCHIGLIDKTKTDEPSAKLDVLLPQIQELMDEGHKVLVFSQFTSFLAIVRDRLDTEQIDYEYLDGRTRDRQSKVDRFQTDPECRLFLISLKAGGVGLNLTAADYVFILDPWWNPAVEAQAIDRAHRIGQDKQVFAYRLIARDTVEEKVLQLQATKRDLADAIINADNSLIRGLGRDDLELLLS